MIVKRLKIINILSIADAEISFDTSGLVLVEGWNYDVGRANGAGKTAIFNALAFGLYEEIPRKITASQIIRDGTKKGFVEVDIQVNNDIYTVIRERPTNVTFYKNGDKINISQSEFEKLIKLSYNQFLVSMYTAQSFGNKFINQNDSAKKDFLLQLMNLDNFADCKKIADDKVKEFQKNIDSERLKLEKAKSQIEVYKELVVDEESIKEVVAKNEQDLTEYRKQIKQFEELANIDLDKYDKLENEINKKQNVFLQTRMQRTYTMDKYNEILAKKNKVKPKKADAHCPDCKVGLNIVNDTLVKASDEKELLKQHELVLAQINEQLVSLKTTLDEQDLILDKENDVRELSNKVKHKKIADTAQYRSSLNKIAELKNLINNKTKENSTLLERMSSNSETQKKIASLECYMAKALSCIEEYESQLLVYDLVSTFYSSTGAPAYILDSAIDTFNDLIKQYVDVVWPNASYQLNSYKENSKGEIKAKFSETLIIDGKEKTIGSLSGGELRGLSLAVDFAMIDVVCRHFGIELNPLIMDEPFEGLDDIGREIVINLLQKLSDSRQILVVDHATEAKAMFSKVIRVEKRDGVSVVINT